MELRDGVTPYHARPYTIPQAYKQTFESKVQRLCDMGVLRKINRSEWAPNGAWTLRTYIKPLTNWIWAGALLMALGGGLSLTDRRFRVAAGARRKAPVSTVNAPAE